jgi:hypothetical protein
MCKTIVDAIFVVAIIRVGPFHGFKISYINFNVLGEYGMKYLLLLEMLMFLTLGLIIYLMIN